MDPRRTARYVDKLDHARQRLQLVDAWLSAAGGDVQARLATYKAFQEAAKTSSDVAAMAVVDGGHAAKDDYGNISALVDAGLMDESLAAHLREATGLRNRLVHEYERLRDAVALESIGRLTPAVAEFLEVMERWLTSQSA